MIPCVMIRVRDIFHVSGKKYGSIIIGLNHVELGGTLMRSMHVAADSRWHIGRQIYLATEERLYIVWLCIVTDL